MKINFTAAIIFTFASTLSHAASFDCKKASTFVEKTICNESPLNKLDDVLSENYKNISASNIGDGARKDLKTTQRAWLAVRNKCADNKCLANQYKRRIDEICNDYPVITGVHPGCTSYEEDESELGGVKPQQAIVQPRKDELATKAPVQKDATKNVEKIKQLKLPANFVNSTLYVNYLGQWVDFMSCGKWLGLLLDNKKIESVQGISADGNSGVSIKRPGNPSFGLLFRIEGKEAYLTAFVVGNEVNPIQTPAEHSQMAVLMKSLTNEETMN